MKSDLDSPLDSYSLAAMARTEDILGYLVSDLEIVGSKDAFKNVLYGVRLVVEGKNRRLTDFSEIINPEEDENSSIKQDEINANESIQKIRCESIISKQKNHLPKSIKLYVLVNSIKYNSFNEHNNTNEKVKIEP